MKCRSWTVLKCVGCHSSRSDECNQTILPVPIPENQLRAEWWYRLLWWYYSTWGWSSQAHKRSLGSCSPFIQLVLPEKLLRIMKDDINVTFWGWSRACKHTQLLLGSNVHGREGLSLRWRLLHKTDKKNALCHYDRPIHGDGICRCFWKHRHTSHS